MLGTTLLALIALFGVFAFVALKLEGLALFAPATTGGITNAAAAYCAAECRLTDDRCPMSGSHERALNCPLWKFIEADLPTTRYGNPFEKVQQTARRSRP
ncbi:MAG TPA: hypothetical protein VEU55_03385 [Gemmatimonadales bacterium]|nr:hypothetical protein [Gemmatimonadales bacterium]